MLQELPKMSISSLIAQEKEGLEKNITILKNISCQNFNP